MTGNAALSNHPPSARHPFAGPIPVLALKDADTQLSAAAAAGSRLSCRAYRSGAGRRLQRRAGQGNPSLDPVFAGCAQHGIMRVKGDAWPSGGEPNTERPVKIGPALPRDAKISAGEPKLRGYARFSGCPIRSVHWSDGGGERWQRAAPAGPSRKYGRVRFRFTWQPEQCRHCLTARAADQKGRAQPDTVPFNPVGCLFNATCKHPVAVLRR